uniref:Metallophos domain-containing protein n=1 Tax=Macrostomum lignano TaxID=282301 RepID=A0A1I8G7Q8_9PLAT
NFQENSTVSVRVARGLNGHLEGLLDETDWSGEFCFVQAADTQFGLISRYIDKADPQPADSPTNRDADIAKEVHLTRRLVSEVNAISPAPRFLIVCGDMIDAFPVAVRDENGEQRREREQRRQRQLRAFADCFRQLRSDIPLVCVCGNHDIGDAPTPESVGIYRQTWGDDYFEFWIGGCQMLVVNSQYYVNSSQVPEEKSAMTRWLMTRLSQGKPAHRILFMHVPPFLTDAHSDADSYFTLPKADRLPLLDACLEAGVSAIFCGHYHRNAGGVYRDKLPVVVTSAVGAQIGNDRHGYRLVNVAKDAVRHSYVDLACEPVNLTNGADGCKACQ